jgi:hypothetical protein
MRSSTKTALLIALGATVTLAGPKLTFDDGKSSVELTQAWQFWAVGTYNPVDIPEPDQRLDLLIRRARFGFKGIIRPRLDYQVQFAFDNLGKDPYTGTIGRAQKLENTEFRVWELFGTYHIDSTWANLTFGLFRPQVSREFVNAYSGVPSLDYALSFYYERDHLDTRPTAREVGLNLGGLHADSSRWWGVGYNIGLFDAVQEKASDLAGMVQWWPMVTGRVTVSLGQPESHDYKLVPDVNHFGKRMGVTLGGYATYQGQVDELYDPKDSVYIKSGTSLVQKTKGYKGGFKNNEVFGADVLLNLAGFELDAEYSWLRREFTTDFAAAYPTVVLSNSYADHVWHVRGGYSFPILKTQFVEPSVMYTRFDGSDYSLEYQAGEDYILDAGLNWYIKKNNLKVSLHWLRQGGEAKSMYESRAATATAKKVRDDAIALGVQFVY